MKDSTVVLYQYEISVLEEKMKLMKPNMAAIAEFRKKVRCSTLESNLNVPRFSSRV